MKHCTDCAVSKPLDDFPPSKKNRDGRSTYCKVCMRERSKASYRKRAAQQGRTVRSSPAEVASGWRRCPDCAVVKQLADFCRNKNTADGHATYCRDCHNARSRETRDRLYGGGRHYHLMRRYGMTAEQVDELIAAQGGVCAVCRTRPPGHVDHDHVTGRVRGVLCSGCNQGLGNFRDDVHALRAAIDYLET